jgi:hypothetical protein
VRIVNANVIHANVTNDLALTTLTHLTRQRPRLPQVHHDPIGLYLGSRAVIQAELIKMTDIYTREARVVLPLGLPSTITAGTPQAERHYVQAAIYAESAVDGITTLFPDGSLLYELHLALVAVLHHRILEGHRSNADRDYRTALLAAMGTVSRRVTDLLDRTEGEAAEQGDTATDPE